ncbi:methyltransferase domain-containing protein [Alteromonas sp. SM 2104]|nr:methyltransferase domain-containing protein [Alteromonas oceanisediminis]
MKAALRKQAPLYPRSWKDIPNGERLKLAITSECDDVSRRLFGYHLVRLGVLSAGVELKNCPIHHVVNVTHMATPATNVRAQSNALPFSENSVDAFLLVNELDFASDPHQILREVDRVVTPNGYIVLTGFNPFSLDYLFRFLYKKSQRPLSTARYFSQARVRDWLQLLGFEIIESRSIAFFPLHGRRFLSRHRRLQSWYRRLLPWSGSGYLVVARKREIPLSLIKPSWRLKPRFNTVGASVRHQA